MRASGVCVREYSRSLINKLQMGRLDPPNMLEHIFIRSNFTSYRYLIKNFFKSIWGKNNVTVWNFIQFLPLKFIQSLKPKHFLLELLYLAYGSPWWMREKFYSSETAMSTGSSSLREPTQKQTCFEFSLKKLIYN